MKAIEGYRLVRPDELAWRRSNLMRIPNADYLERTGSEILGARLWRMPPKSANTLHKHVRAEEFYFVLEGVGANASWRRDHHNSPSWWRSCRAIAPAADIQ